jgi:hypothetical protein
MPAILDSPTTSLLRGPSSRLCGGTIQRVDGVRQTWMGLDYWVGVQSMHMEGAWTRLNILGLYVNACNLAHNLHVRRGSQRSHARIPRLTGQGQAASPMSTSPT